MLSSTPSRRDAVACVLLFLVAVLVRVLFLLSTVDRDLPFSIFYYGDSRVYREFALAILRGEVFDQGVAFHPPGFAYALAMVIGATGERPALMRALLAVVSASSVPLTYLLGLKIWGRGVAWVGALLATFSFGLLVTAVSANTETIYIPILTLQVLLLVFLGDALVERRDLASGVLAGASGFVLGIGALTRVEHLAMVVLLPLALWLGWRALSVRRVTGVLAVLAVVTVIVIGPWTIKSHRSITAFNAEHPGLAEPLPALVLVSGYGPLNFALANNPAADGTFRADALLSRMGKGRLDFRDPDQLEPYLHGYRSGWKYLVGDPRGGFRLLVRKLDLAADAFALGLGVSNRPAGLRGTRRCVDLFVPERRIWKPLALLWVLLGLWLSRSLWRRWCIVGIVGLHMALLSMAFFGYARLFVQIVPLVACLQAALLVAGWERLGSAGLRRGLAGAGIALATALLVEAGLAARAPRNFQASGSVDPATGKIVQDAVVELAPAP